MEQLEDTCKWNLTYECTDSCFPKWVYNCVGRDEKLRVASHGCDGQLWNACPSWSQWTPASSLRFWKTPSEFRFRACPCDCSQLARPGSRIFQSDRSTGHCLQVKLPLEENAFLWECVYFCLLFFVCIMLIWSVKEHVMKNAADRQTTQEDATEQEDIEIIKDTQKVQDDEATLVI